MNPNSSNPSAPKTWPNLFGSSLPPVPNIPAPPLPQAPLPKDPEDEEKKEIKLLEKLLAANILLTLGIGLVVLVLIVLSVTGKINLLAFVNNSGLQTITPTPTQGPKLAAEKEMPFIYVSDQKVNADQIFNAPSDKLKLTVTGTLKKEIMGFLPYWMVPKSDEINTSLLTSISYFGLEVDGQGNIIKTDNSGGASTAWSIWENDPKLNVFIRNAKKNRIKVYLTLKAFDNGNIERLVRSPEAQKNFINTALYQVNSKSLDGINLDFEYVGTPSQDVTDGFSILVADLNKELKRQYPNSVLTIDTYVSSAATNSFFDVPILAKNCDGIVIMCYDFRTARSASAGSMAPMEGEGISVLGYMTSYFEKVPPEKLILAIGYYGYDWPTADSSQNSPVSGGGVKVVPYAEIMAAANDAMINWQDKAETPWYSYKDSATGQTRVVHFENARSLGIKYDLVNAKSMQGIAIWALGYDGKNNTLLQLISDKFAK